MSVRDELKKNLIEAAKAKDQVLLDTVRAIQSAIRYKEIDKKGELSETEVFSVIQTLAKQRRESIDQFKQGGREDLAAKEARELEILIRFLPAQLSSSEVQSVVQKHVKELGAQGQKDMGRVIKAVMQELAGKADGKMVSDVVKSILS